MNRPTFCIAIIFLLAVSAFAQNSVKVGSVAPQFSAMSSDGTPYDLSQLRGRVVVMTFWSTSCAICHAEIPGLNRFIDKFDPKKVVFLALTTDNQTKVAAYIKKNPFRFELLPSSFGTLFQYADRDKEGYMDMGYPAFFVIDQQGIVQFRASGYDKTTQLDAAIRKLVSE